MVAALSSQKRIILNDPPNAIPNSGHLRYLKTRNSPLHKEGVGCPLHTAIEGGAMAWAIQQEIGAAFDIDRTKLSEGVSRGSLKFWNQYWNYQYQATTFKTFLTLQDFVHGPVLQETGCKSTFWGRSVFFTNLGCHGSRIQAFRLRMLRNEMKSIEIVAYPCQYHHLCHKLSDKRLLSIENGSMCWTQVLHESEATLSIHLQAGDRRRQRWFHTHHRASIPCEKKTWWLMTSAVARLRMFSGDCFMTSNERHSPPKTKQMGAKRFLAAWRGLEVECCSFLFSVRETPPKKRALLILQLWGYLRGTPARMSTGGHLPMVQVFCVGDKINRPEGFVVGHTCRVPVIIRILTTR